MFKPKSLASYFLNLTWPRQPAADAAEIRFVLKLTPCPHSLAATLAAFTLITRTASCLRQLPELRCRLPARFPIATCSMSLIPFAPFIAESSTQSRLLVQHNEQVSYEKEQAGIDQDR